MSPSPYSTPQKNIFEKKKFHTSEYFVLQQIMYFQPEKHNQGSCKISFKDLLQDLLVIYPRELDQALLLCLISN